MGSIQCVPQDFRNARMPVLLCVVESRLAVLVFDGRVRTMRIAPTNPVALGGVGRTLARHSGRGLLHSATPRLSTGSRSRPKGRMILGNPRSIGKTIADVTSADRLRIYIDRSMLGGCFDSEFATWSNGLVRPQPVALYWQRTNRGLLRFRSF